MIAAQQPSAEKTRLRTWWRRWLRLAPDRDRSRHVVHQLYAALVAQARSEAFYGPLGVPDTPEGRFEMIGLHTALLLRRLRAEGIQGRALGQELFDLMFADLDVNLRELGVGDLSVGRYVKRLAQNFLARIAALDAGLSGPDLDSVVAMLRSNVYYGGPPPAPSQVETLARYVAELDASLAAQPAGAVLEGRVCFVAAPGAGGTGASSDDERGKGSRVDV